MVKRYSLDGLDCEVCDLEPDNEGYWVTYDDYAAKADEHDKLRRLNDELISVLRAAARGYEALTNESKTSPDKAGSD